MHIETTGLGKNYGEVTALQDVSVRLGAGTVGLLGPNGAGKSTFLKIVSGLMEPTSGGVKVFGHRLDEKVKTRIGIMPEYPCLIETLNAVDFVMYMGVVSGMARRDALTRAHEVLDYCRIGEERYRKISEYSGGMKQKVKLAQAIVHDPEIILLDEPVAAVDPRSREEILSVIRELKTAEGRLILLSTHLLEDVEVLCDEVVLIDRGSVVLQGKIGDVLKTDVAYVRFRVKGDIAAFAGGLKSRGFGAEILKNEVRSYTTDEKVIDAAVAVCAELALELRSVEKGVRTLEDVFLLTVRGRELDIARA